MYLEFQLPVIENIWVTVYKAFFLGTRDTGVLKFLSMPQTEYLNQFNYYKNCYFYVDIKKKNHHTLLKTDPEQY